MSYENTNWGQSAAGVVLRDGKVLLARHTYGKGAGKLIIPGGYVNFGETPQDALVREYLEETGVTVKPKDIIGIRFNMHDWYVVFRAEYVSGTAVSDLTKKMIESAVSESAGLEQTDYKYSSDTPNYLYSLKNKG